MRIKRLVHLGVSNFFDVIRSCNSSLKYNKIISAFGDSTFNLFEFRKIEHYLAGYLDKPSGYHYSTDVITNYNIPKILNCPINIIGMDLLGFTWG